MSKKGRKQNDPLVADINIFNLGNNGYGYHPFRW
jgi:hypothetical protein